MMEIAPAAWADDAPCQGLTELMFDGYAFEVAQDVCRQCDYRRDCFLLAMYYEAGAPALERFGVWGGLTPLQRWRVQSKGAAWCPHCDEMFDPLDHETGVLQCAACRRVTKRPPVRATR